MKGVEQAENGKDNDNNPPSSSQSQNNATQNQQSQQQSQQKNQQQQRNQQQQPKNTLATEERLPYSLVYYDCKISIPRKFYRGNLFIN